MENTTLKTNLVRLTVLLITLTLGACSAPLTPSTESRGDLTVRSGQPGTRSLLPNLGTLTYDLVMAGPASAVISVTDDADGIFPLKHLTLGLWTATIDIKSNGTVIATGTAAKNITPSSSGILDVAMTYVYGTGTVLPLFSVSASASPYPILAAAVLWDGTPLAAVYDITSQAVDLSLGPQPVGTHTLAITFYRDSQKTLPVGSYQTVLVCLAAGGAFPNITLGPNDFHAPGAPEMVAVPGGTFTYGTAATAVSPFLIGKYSVTQAQFQAVMGYNPSYFNNSNTGANANPEATWSPVEQVSMWDAMEYCNRLSLTSGLEPVYTLTGITRSGSGITDATVVTDLTRNGYRLPTDAEWEYAARGGTASAYIWGEAPDSGGTYSWTINSSLPSGGRTHGVGQKTPNALGLYDVFGNVFQFTNDWYAAIPTGPLSDYAGPVNPSAGPLSKITRGSAWNDSYAATQNVITTRFYAGGVSANNTGFRVARRNLIPALAVMPSVPEATLDGGYGRFLYVAADQQHPGKFLVSGVSGLIANTGTSPWGTNLMARFNNDATLDPTFGNNTDVALHAAQSPWGPTAMFSLFNQTSVIQTQYGQSFYSGFAQNSWGLYLFQPSYAGGWNHTEVYRHDANGVLGVGYSQPVYTPHTQYFLPFVVYGQFRTFGPPAVDGGGIMYSTGYDAVTGNMAINRMEADGAFPWQNDPANYNNRYYQSPFPIASLVPIRTAFQPDGNLLVVGNDNTATGVEGKLIRVILGASSGTLDTGFASGGTFTFNNGNADGSQRHYSSVQALGSKIYLAGWDYLSSTTPPGLGGFVHILNLDGTIDTTITLPHPFDRPNDLAVAPNGTVVVVGTTGTSPSRAFAYVMAGNGTNGKPAADLLDPGFGSGALSVAIDSSNNVAVAGYTNKAGGTEERHTLPAFWRF